MKKPRKREPDRWLVTVEDAARNDREDEQICALEERLQGLYRARAGRVINEYGWAWCASCGAVSVICDRTTVALVKGRSPELCSGCLPHVKDYEALAAWRDLPKSHRSSPDHYRTFARSFGGKGTPIAAVEFAAARARPRAVLAAEDVIEARDTYISPVDVAVLSLDPEGHALAAKALAALRARIQAACMPASSS